MVGKAKKPRLIQGRSDRAKVAMGPWFDTAGKVLSHVWGKTDKLYYTSGATAEDLGEWAAEAEALGLIPMEWDFAAFDTTVGPAPHALWGRVNVDAGAPTDVLRIIDARLAPLKGKTRWGCKYQKLAQVSSGDGDTSVGNSFIHGLGWLWVLEQLVPALAEQCKVAILGDDSVVAAPPSAVSALRDSPRLWALLGLRIEMKVDLCWDTVSFCSGYFWRTGGGTRTWGPNPARVLAKSFWTTVPFAEKKSRMWLRGVLIGFRKDASHVPLISTLVERLLSLVGSEGEVVLRRRYDGRLQSAARRNTSPLAWEQLSLVSDMPISVLIEMDNELRNCQVDSVLRGNFVTLLEQML